MLIKLFSDIAKVKYFSRKNKGKQKNSKKRINFYVIQHIFDEWRPPGLIFFSPKKEFLAHKNINLLL